MAINRTKSWFGTSLYGSAPAPAEWAFATGGGSISMFVSNGSGAHNYAGCLYRVHTFTGNTSITFTQGGYVDLLVVAGGGAGGASYDDAPGGGGGGGGVLEVYQAVVEAGSYTITVGAGGAKNTSDAFNGGNSSFGSYIAYGGGSGGVRYYDDAGSGGSGGGSSCGTGATGGGSVPGQGYAGGTNTIGSNFASGGGGAGGPGGWTSTLLSSGYGGIGRLVSFDSDIGTYYSGGGGGGTHDTAKVQAFGGLGGGASGVYSDNSGADAFFYGGGGGGASYNPAGWVAGGAGYQGIVMVRYVVNP